MSPGGQFRFNANFSVALVNLANSTKSRFSDEPEGWPVGTQVVVALREAFEGESPAIVLRQYPIRSRQFGTRSCLSRLDIDLNNKFEAMLKRRSENGIRAVKESMGEEALAVWHYAHRAMLRHVPVSNSDMEVSDAEILSSLQTLYTATGYHPVLHPLEDVKAATDAERIALYRNRMIIKDFSPRTWKDLISANFMDTEAKSLASFLIRSYEFSGYDPIVNPLKKDPISGFCATAKSDEVEWIKNSLLSGTTEIPDPAGIVEGLAKNLSGVSITRSLINSLGKHGVTL